MHQMQKCMEEGGPDMCREMMERFKSAPQEDLAGFENLTGLKFDCQSSKFHEGKERLLPRLASPTGLALTSVRDIVIARSLVLSQTSKQSLFWFYKDKRDCFTPVKRGQASKTRSRNDKINDRNPKS